MRDPPRDPNTTGAAAPSLGRRAFVGSARFMLFLILLIFLPAGTIAYWQGWLFCAVFMLCMAVTSIYFVKHDPALVERRMRVGPAAEKEPTQKRILTFASIVFCAIILIPAFDYRFGWSQVPIAVVILGNLLVITGFVMIFFVLRENAFAAATIEINPGQRVIATGPYARVRHPMYAGAIVMFSGIPLALGSWWGLLLLVPLIAVLIWRLEDEERFLVLNLPGYDDYRGRVPYRLVPGLY